MRSVSSILLSSAPMACREVSILIILCLILCLSLVSASPITLPIEIEADTAALQDDSIDPTCGVHPLKSIVKKIEHTRKFNGLYLFQMDKLYLGFFLFLAKLKFWPFSSKFLDFLIALDSFDFFKINLNLFGKFQDEFKFILEKFQRILEKT